MSTRKPAGKRWLALEFTGVFVVVPALFYFLANRWNMHTALWAITLFGIIMLKRADGFSWRVLWEGAGWSRKQKEFALLRFAVAAALTIPFTLLIAPDRLFQFPMQRPVLWLAVMVLYPVLSALPQEFMFRSYFFRRYQPLFPQAWMMIAASALCFGFVHTAFHNWVSPLLSLIGGAFFAHSYSQHRSLKWAAIEHAAYGCMVFTVGLGLYFLVGSLHAH